MIVGDLVAMLRLDGVDAFNRGLSNAGSNFAGLSSRASASVRAIDGVLTVVGNTINATAGMVLGIGANAITAGAGFNNLQQNAGVALKTLMGSTEAAEAQMAKLNDFANGSPFGRDTLIQAQQQMIGFGIEADNVVPYLGAVQDAVAGIGGSNQDITEIVSIISRIRSGATLGQEDLNQLADRGINAAALIAQATGQTEQEVRNSIFGNPLRGEEALAGLDAMMSGMQERFDGAAEGLKNNLDGARDRVKAAMRDIGAVISAPVIDPTGGGWGVTLTNTYADILRGVQTAITPMVDELATRMAPGVMNVNTQLQALASTIRQIDMADLRSGFAGIEPFLPVIAGGFAALTTQGLKAVPVLGGILGGITPLVAGFSAAAAASPEVRDGIAAILSAAEPLVPVIGDLATIVGGVFSSGLAIAGDLLGAVAPLVGFLAEAIAAVPDPMLQAATAITLGAVAMRAFTGSVQVKSMSDLATQGSKLATSFDGLRITAMYAGDAMRDARAQGAGPLNTAMSGLTPIATGAAGAIGRVGTALKTAFLANPVGIIIAGVATAVSAIAMASANADQKVAEWRSEMEGLRGTLDQTTGAMTEQTAAMVMQNLQASEWGTRAKELANGTGTVTDMMRAATGEGDEFIATLISLAAEQENWNKKLTAGSVESFATAMENSGTTAEEWIEASHGLGDSVDVLREKFMAAGYTSSEFDHALARVGEKGINNDALEEIATLQGQLGTAASEVIETSEALDRMESSTSAAAQAQTDLAEALGIASDNANSAQERIRAVREAIDILNGGTLTAAEQQQKLDDAVRSVTEAFEKAEAAEGVFTSDMIDANGVIDTSTEAGSAFRDSLTSMSDEMYLAAEAAANQAAAMGEDPYTAAMDAMTPYMDQLTALADEYGLTEEQAAGLLASLGMFPDDIALALSMTGVTEAEGELGAIAYQLANLEDGETQLFVDADTDAARERLEELGFEITETSDGRWRIDLSADPIEAQEQIEALMNYVTESDPTANVHANPEPAEETVNAWKEATDATLAISTADADAAEARGEVLAWKLEADGTWSVSHMDAEKAEADSTVITWKRDADGTWGISNLGADTGVAYGDLNSFIDSAGNTWVSVNVGADVSSANASIASLTGQSVYVDVYPQMMNAIGGMYAYENGGMAEAALGIQAFADGGTPHRTLQNGIYPGGRPIYKFAEPETGWEAFVSGKRGMERRNLAILADAQERLMRQLGLVNVRAFADGASVGGSPAPALAGPQTVFNAPLVHVEHAVLDSPDRVDELANKLWQRADQAARSQGRIDLGGPVS